MNQEHAKPNDAQPANDRAGIANPAPNPIIPGHSRRMFLFKVALFLNGIVGAVIAIPIVGYIIGPALKKSSSENAWIGLGKVGDFPEGETRLATFRNPVTTPWDGETGNIPCWVRRISGNDFQVFAINCAHLGCPVRWFAQSSLFLCPCHGGVYYQDGSRASGPPERGLFEYAHKIVDGNLMIYAGKVPTLAYPLTSKNCGGPRLTQIQPAVGAEASAATAPQTDRATAGDDAWPA
jgi:menaquinol-cytochrome c reductase iron-sulfur subunit